MDGKGREGDLGQEGGIRVAQAEFHGQLIYGFDAGEFTAIRTIRRA